MNSVERCYVTCITGYEFGIDVEYNYCTMNVLDP